MLLHGHCLMKKITFFLMIVMLTSCGGNSSSSEFVLKPGIDPNELIFKKGDCLAFNIDSLTYGVALVFEVTKDGGGIWYGILFTDYSSPEIPHEGAVRNRRLLGRRMEEKLPDEPTDILLEGEFVNAELISEENSFSLVGNVRFNEQAHFGLYGACDDFAGYVDAFKTALDKRTKPPEDPSNAKSNPNVYFDLNDFID
jgi:hypothetical protein